MKLSFLLPFVLLCAACATTSHTDPLPSWNDGQAKHAVMDFVSGVTRSGSRDWVEPSARVAVFDNDGTLWAEQPIYVQFVFAIDRLKELAPKHPEWRQDPVLAAAIEGDLKTVFAGGDKALLKVVMASHAGMTPDEFEGVVKSWTATARHPATHRAYTSMVYQPMLELLAYLRANGFETFIVSGGGVEFMRSFSQSVYGVRPDQVIGSRIKMELKDDQNGPRIVRLPDVDFIDDGPGKPVAIQEQIGRRPIAAFGNSDGDLQMLQWTTAGSGPRFGLIVHHTDAEREWAYDRESKIGHLEKALDAAASSGWTVVDMKRDWKQVFPKE